MPGRWAIVLAGAAVAVAAQVRPSGQSPELTEVLNRAAAYVQRFHQQLSQIVSEETYAQTVVHTARLTDSMLLLPSRTLRSDLILVRSAAEDRFVELRDVFEVDGKPVRDRQARLERLLGANSQAAGNQIAAIIQESARYNVGTIQRNVNTPLLALTFLQDNYQSRFTFKHVTKETPVFKESRDRALNDTPVFRVATEMWTIEYRERRNATVIRTPSGSSLPARGRFWIDPSTGAVLISELIVDGGGVIATVTVSYQSEPLMGFLVPTEMRESYLRYGERITGHAVYGKFRLLKQ
jgi:hypothetical protein